MSVYDDFVSENEIFGWMNWNNRREESKLDEKLHYTWCSDTLDGDLDDNDDENDDTDDEDDSVSARPNIRS